MRLCLMSSYAYTMNNAFSFFRYVARFNREQVGSGKSTRYNIQNVKVHEGFEFREGVKIENDIAILTLSEEITFTDRWLPICLPSKNSNYDETEATFMGEKS